LSGGFQAAVKLLTQGSQLGLQLAEPTGNRRRFELIGRRGGGGAQREQNQCDGQPSAVDFHGEPLP
jgi:hypothetical protein